MLADCAGANSDRSKTPLWSRPFVGALFILGATLCAYYNTLSAPFLFDDYAAVVNNPSIRHISSSLAPAADGSTAAGRPLVNLSFAVNYAIGGLRVEGYHAFNVGLHIASGLLLFGLVRRTLERLSRGDCAVTNNPVAFGAAVAAIWTLHPLQTESVTCIAQRTELCVGFFYLLTLYCFLRTVDGTSVKRPWAVGMISASILGMLSKEVMVSAPLVVFLYDRTFVAGSFRAASKHRHRLHLALAATWIPLLILVASGSGTRGVAAGFGLGISWSAYALKQCEAIIRYLRLAIWPEPLVLDYGTGVAIDPTWIAWQGLMLGLMIAGTAFALFRRPILGFVGTWFFAILAPSSSVIPLVTQTVAEHRMYLPLAAVVVLLVFAIAKSHRAFPTTVVALLVVALAVVTARRNADYRSEIAIWQDTVAKLPNNPRAHNNLGFELAKMPGRIADALAEYERALQLDLYDADAHYNLANELARLPGRTAEAIAHYTQTLSIKPGYMEAHNNLGLLLANDSGRLAEAEAHLKNAVQAKPTSARLHNNLGLVLSRLAARSAEAQQEYREAVRLDPGYSEAHYNLATELAKLPGHAAEAISHYEEAVRLKPDYVEARFNLAVELAKIPTRKRDAIQQYEETLRLSPDLTDAHNNLAIEYATAGRTDEAIRHFERALALNPNFENARENLKILQTARKK
jgi:tetratricopeptide (TPR) repeat protein